MVMCILKGLSLCLCISLCVYLSLSLTRRHPRNPRSRSRRRRRRSQKWRTQSHRHRSSCRTWRLMRLQASLLFTVFLSWPVCVLVLTGVGSVHMLCCLLLSLCLCLCLSLSLSLSLSLFISFGYVCQGSILSLSVTLRDTYQRTCYQLLSVGSRNVV